MEKLPSELLEKVFSLLRVPDRLRAALVCHRWAEIVSTPRSLRDVHLVFHVLDLQRATPILLDSHRQYTNLKICGGTLNDFHAEFWARIAGELVLLQLEKCDLSAEVFYAILGECQKLQCLAITDCGRVASFGLLESEYPENICVAKVQQSLRNVRHLSLRKNRFLTEASFNQMLTLMPNITTLWLVECWNLQFNPGIIRGLHTDTIEFSSAVLTFQNVLVCMTRSRKDFVDLDFSCTLINDEALIQIVKLYRESLTSLLLRSCGLLGAKAYEAIGECSKLLLLSLEATSQTTDDNLECILTKTPGLEHLHLGLCPLISSRSVQLIIHLKKLRRLSLHFCQRIDIDSLGSLGALTDLQHLDLSYTTCDVKALRQLASLKDLRILELRECVNLDTECFVIICDNFKRLEKLDLKFSFTLRDEARCKFHQLKNLRSLNITGFEGISGQSLKNGLGASDMKFLSMGRCHLLTDSALLSIVNHHVCLEYLGLSGCVRITDVGLISVVQRLPRLRTLILYRCRLLTDQSLLALHDHCPHLRKLNVQHCSMSADAIDRLAHLRPIIDLN